MIVKDIHDSSLPLKQDFFNLFGISFRVYGDTDVARERAYLAQRLMFQMKMTNTQDLDIVENHLKLDDGTVVHVMSQHGLDTAQIYVPPKEEAGKQYIERQVVVYLPSFDAYNAAHEIIGVVVCRGGGFQPPYEFIPTSETLPHDVPDNVDFAELPDIRIWEYNDKTYTDIRPGKYTPQESVMETPDNTSSLTWTITGPTAQPCCDYDWIVHWVSHAGYFNEYERSHSFSHDKAITFGPGESERWPSVYWEGRDRYYWKPKEFTLNLDEQDFHNFESGSGACGIIEDVGYATDVDDCDVAKDLAIISAEAIRVTNEYIWDPDDPNNQWRSLADPGYCFGEWEDFYYNVYAGCPYSAAYCNYVTYTNGYFSGDWLDASIQDENHFAVFYDIWDWVQNTSGGWEMHGDWYDGLNNDCSSVTIDSPTALVRDVDTMVVTPKIALNQFTYSLSDYPEILGQNSLQNSVVRYYSHEDFEIGLYWILGYDGGYIGNYIAVTASGEVISVAATPRNYWNEEFPGVTDGDGNSVLIKDNGEIRLIREEETIIEEVI